MAASNYTNITIRFTDDKAFVVPPSAYLQDDRTSNGIPMCQNMIMGSNFTSGIAYLGSTFLENYLVVYDFLNDRIGLNGFVIKDQPVVPPKGDDAGGSSPTLAIVLSIIGVVLLTAAVAVVVMRVRRGRKELGLYDELDKSMDADQVYQTPIIKEKKYSIQ